MNKSVAVYDLVAENGKTIKENNLERKDAYTKKPTRRMVKAEQA